MNSDDMLNEYLSEILARRQRAAEIYSKKEVEDLNREKLAQDTNVNKNILSGASYGAGIGGMFGGVGAIPGAIIGAGIGTITGAIKATKARKAAGQEHSFGKTLGSMINPVAVTKGIFNAVKDSPGEALNVGKGVSGGMKAAKDSSVATRNMKLPETQLATSASNYQMAPPTVEAPKVSPNYTPGQSSTPGQQLSLGQTGIDQDYLKAIDAAIARGDISIDPVTGEMIPTGTNPYSLKSRF